MMATNVLANVIQIFIMNKVKLAFQYVHNITQSTVLQRFVLITVIIWNIKMSNKNITVLINVQMQVILVFTFKKNQHIVSANANMVK